MAGEGTCAFCERPGRLICRRCDRPYCIEHGGQFCAVCSDPVSGLPSPRLFQVTVWALPACVVLGLWFLIGTPRLPGEGGAAGAPVVPQATSRLSTPIATPARTATATTTPTAQDYTVRQGDTLESIATAAGVTTAAIIQLNPGIEPSNIQIGQVIHMPAKPQ